MSAKPSIIGLIPARAGSKRIKDKNVRVLAGHPVLGLYDRLGGRRAASSTGSILSTDFGALRGDRHAITAPRCRSCGRRNSRPRPRPISSGSITRSTGAARRRQRMTASRSCGRRARCGRPRRSAAPGTSSAPGGRRFTARDREIPPASGQDVGVHDKRMVPLMPLRTGPQPWHSMQMASLPDVYVQNASLEIAWSRVSSMKTHRGRRRSCPSSARGWKGSTSTTRRTGGIFNICIGDRRGETAAGLGPSLSRNRS